MTHAGWQMHVGHWERIHALLCKATCTTLNPEGAEWVATTTARSRHGFNGIVNRMSQS